MNANEIIGILTNHIRDPLLICEADPANMSTTRISWCNQAFADLTGYAIDDLIGKPSQQLFDSTPDREVRKRLSQFLATGQSISEDIHFIRQDGGNLRVRLDVHPINDQADGRRQWLTTAHALPRESMATIPDQPAPSKPAFLNHLAHEIRTPLNAVMGYIELLQMTQLSDQQANYLEVLSTASHMLLGLINNVLDLARLESHEAVLNESNFDLHECVHSCVNLMTGWAHTKKLRLHVNIHPKTPTVVSGDALRVRQIILNILTNAIKFTPEGCVRVSVMPNATNGIDICIEDTGIGVPQERLDAIFMEYVQASATTAHIYGGSGLGLNLSRRLARIMGGDIEISSTVGIGTRVRITLPLVAAATTDVDASEGQSIAWAPKAIGKGKNIMIVDDNPMTCDLVANMLEKVGYNVQTATDGQNAIALAADNQRQYNAILMDIRLPDMNGIEATREIVARTRGRYTPHIIACTADDLADATADYEMAGICDQIMKPFRMSELLERLKQWA